MFKYVVTFVLYLVAFSCEGMIIYHVTVENRSNDNLSFRLNSGTLKPIFPFQSIKLRDTIHSPGGYTFAYSEFNIYSGNQNHLSNNIIPFVITNKSNIKVIIKDAEQINNRKGYTITGLPFYNEQQSLIQKYFPQKNDNDLREKSEYSKRKDPKYTRLQVDSIIEGTLQRRKDYYSFIESFITSTKNSEVAYHIYKTEFLKPQAIIGLGKQKLMTTFKLLDTIWKNTEIGVAVLKDIEKIKATSIGSIVQNFRFKTRDLKEFYLYDLINSSQQVLLIFTSRGCKACKEQIPVVKEIEKKLSPNLQVVYVSLDLNPETWALDLIEGYPGLVTLNLEPYNYSVDLEELFMVNFIPQVFLIDNNHKIVYDNLSPYKDDSLNDLKDLLDVMVE